MKKFICKKRDFSYNRFMKSFFGKIYAVTAVLFFLSLIIFVMFQLFAFDASARVIRAPSRTEVHGILINVLYFLMGYIVFTFFFLILKNAMPQKKPEEKPEKLTKNIDPNILDKRVSMQKPEPIIHGQLVSLRDSRIWPLELLKLRLNNEIERSTENEADLGFIIFQLGKDFTGEPKLIDGFEKIILEVFRYSDMIYNLAPYYYGVIVPNRRASECLRLIKRFLQITETIFAQKREIYVGYSTRCGRMVNSKRLFKESLMSVSQAGPDKKQIIHFKPDLHKYQRLLAELRNNM